MVETLVLSLAGSVLGLALAFGALRLLVAMAPTGLPRLHEIGINLPVLLFTLAVTLFVTFVIGMIPGDQVFRSTRQHGTARRRTHPQREPRTASRAQGAGRSPGGLALVLLICSGLMIRTFRALAHVSPGFADPATLQAFRIYIPETQIPDTEKANVIRAEQAIKDRLSAIPGVNSVSAATDVPMDSSGSFDPVFAADRTYKEGEIPPIRRFRFVLPGFFSTMGTPLLAGRDLTWDEMYQKRPVALISESFAREYWGTPANAVGKRDPCRHNRRLARDHRRGRQRLRRWSEQAAQFYGLLAAAPGPV